ncbi:helix-turn-helix domain-containing protein [Halomonas denitrificans]|nr:helix-turn-helix domain-containing protein [Halomonas denitrificans]
MEFKLLNPGQVANLLGVTIGTLSVWRCTGRYPLPFVKVGRRVMYRESDIHAFIEGRIFEQTL